MTMITIKTTTTLPALAALLVAALLTPAIASAQPAEPRQGTRLGFRGGINFADLDTDGASSESIHATGGFVLGAFITSSVGPLLSLQPELLLTWKGGETDEVLGSQAKVRLTYLEVPILLKLSPSRGRVRPAFLVGPAISLLLDGNSRARTPFGTVESDITDEIETLDLGLVFGGSLEVGAGRGAVVVDIRYTLGLLDIDERREGENQRELRNRVLTLSLGFLF